MDEVVAPVSIRALKTAPVSGNTICSTAPTVTNPSMLTGFIIVLVYDFWITGTTALQLLELITDLVAICFG